MSSAFTQQCYSVGRLRNVVLNLWNVCRVFGVPTARGPQVCFISWQCHLIYRCENLCVSTLSINVCAYYVARWTCHSSVRIVICDVVVSGEMWVPGRVHMFGHFIQRLRKSNFVLKLELVLNRFSYFLEEILYIAHRLWEWLGMVKWEGYGKRCWEGCGRKLLWPILRH
jgi:hypothetical protein